MFPNPSRGDTAKGKRRCRGVTKGTNVRKGKGGGVKKGEGRGKSGRFWGLWLAGGGGRSLARRPGNRRIPIWGQRPEGGNKRAGKQKQACSRGRNRISKRGGKKITPESKKWGGNGQSKKETVLLRGMGNGDREGGVEKGVGTNIQETAG